MVVTLSRTENVEQRGFATACNPEPITESTSRNNKEQTKGQKVNRTQRTSIADRTTNVEQQTPNEHHRVPEGPMMATSSPASMTPDILFSTRRSPSPATKENVRCTLVTDPQSAQARWWDKTNRQEIMERSTLRL